VTEAAASRRKEQLAVDPLQITARTARIAALNHEVTRQAAMIGYIDDFALMLIVILACLPLLRRPMPAAADD
jgi:MFS transporter, DHA2 family, multidrug resistance protein